jgi:hypothetical protein
VSYEILHSDQRSLLQRLFVICSLILHLLIPSSTLSQRSKFHSWNDDAIRASPCMHGLQLREKGRILCGLITRRSHHHQFHYHLFIHVLITVTVLACSINRAFTNILIMLVDRIRFVVQLICYGLSLLVMYVDQSTRRFGSINQWWRL